MFKAQLYNGGVETGAQCPCKAAPQAVAPTSGPTGKPVIVNGLQPILMGETMTPSIGNICVKPYSSCTNTRIVKATGAIVHINGKLCARVNDILNAGTSIRLTTATESQGKEVWFA